MSKTKPQFAVGDLVQATCFGKWFNGVVEDVIVNVEDGGTDYLISAGLGMQFFSREVVAR